MGDILQVKTIVTPYEELATGAGGVHTVLASEIGQKLGTSFTSSVNSFDGAAASQGFNGGSPYFVEVDDGAAGTIGTGVSTSYYIYNTGHKYSSSSVLGVFFNKAIKVIAGGNTIAVIAPREGLFFKDESGLVSASTF